MASKKRGRPYITADEVVTAIGNYRYGNWEDGEAIKAMLHVFETQAKEVLRQEGLGVPETELVSNDPEWNSLKWINEAQYIIDGPYYEHVLQAAASLLEIGELKYLLEENRSHEAVMSMSLLIASALLPQEATNTLLVGKYQNLKEVNSQKGKLGAQKKWGDRRTTDSIIHHLALGVDDWGDPIPSNELWSEFFSQLEYAGLSPDDKSGEIVKNEDRMYWAGNSSGMTYKTFKNRLSEFRKKS